MLKLKLSTPVYDTQVLCEMRTGEMWQDLGDALWMFRSAREGTLYAAMAAEQGMCMDGGWAGGVLCCSSWNRLPAGLWLVASGGMSCCRVCSCGNGFALPALRF
jgi:hypothetical protein